MKILVIMPAIWLSASRAAGGNIRMVEVCKRWDGVRIQSVEPRPSISRRLEANYEVHEINLPLRSEELMSGIVNLTLWTLGIVHTLLKWRATGKRFDLVISGLGISNAFHSRVASELFGSSRIVSVQTNGDYTRCLTFGYAKWRRSGFWRGYALLLALGEYVSSRLLRSSSAFVCVSETIANELRLSNIPRDRIHVSSNGVDLERVERCTNEVTSKEFDAAFLGRVEEDKGVLDLLNAWRVVVDEKENARLLIMGSGKSLQRAMELSRTLGLEGNVKFTGYVSGDQKYRHLKKSKFFVYPSKILEGWSLSIAEAMACGLPIILYDNPVFLDIFSACPGMFFVPTGEVNELAKASLALLNEDSLLRRCGESTKDYVKQFDWREIAERELIILKDAVYANAKPYGSPLHERSSV